MKMRIIPVAIMVCILILFVSLSGAISGMPKADGDKLWTYITETSSYLGWGFWPGHTELYEGKSPHGAYLRLYANPIALKAAREGKSMPDGAIIVKENYGKDRKTLMAITPMYKVKGYNPDGGDWFWAKYGPGGNIMKAGKPKGCVSCHRVKQKSDWLFTQPR